MTQVANKRDKDDSFYFEDIIVSEEKENQYKYEGEFEMEPYLDEFRENVPKKIPRNKPFNIPIVIGAVAVLIVLCTLIWMVSHKETKNTSADVPPEIAQVEPEQVEEQIPEEEPEEPEEEPEEVVEQVDEIEEEVPAGPEVEEISLIEPTSGNASMKFDSVSETVTAKDVASVRLAPNVNDVYNIYGQIKKGDTIKRIGVNEQTGWSKVEYNGRTGFALTQFLTTDMDYDKVLVTDPNNRVTTQDGYVMIFADCDDNVTPRDNVNLRTEPSASDGNASVIIKIKKDTVLHRTGISPDSGWSRVEYEGQIAYVVTGYMNVVQ